MNRSAANILVGYDGSLHSSAALNAGAMLLPHADAWITHLWTPPFADEDLRRQLWIGPDHLDQFVRAVEHEGQWRATQITETGVTLARAVGWNAEPLTQRVEGGEGIELAQLTAKTDPDLVLLGARGLGGVQAILESVSDMTVHYSPKPVLVIPHPLLSTNHAALTDGPVVLGWDGSPGSQAALTATQQLVPHRDLFLVTVDDGEKLGPAPTLNGRTLDPVRLEKIHGTPTQAVARTLIKYARTRQAALIAVGSRGRSAVQEIMLGSTAKATLHHAHRPVLVVPDPIQPLT